jgi:hypothetical protein
MLDAFDRAGGELLWYSPTPAQSMLLERFDELPMVLCAATYTRQGANPGEAVGVVPLRSLDKQTGKVIFNKESQQITEPFHALQIDARTDSADLMG